MKLTIKDLVLFYNLYDQIKDRAPSIKTAYKMNKIYERAAQEQTFIQEQQQKIAEKYAFHKSTAQKAKSLLKRAVRKIIK